MRVATFVGVIESEEVVERNGEVSVDVSGAVDVDSLVAVVTKAAMD